MKNWAYILILVMGIGLVNAKLFTLDSVQPSTAGCSIFGCIMDGDLNMSGHNILDANFINATVSIVEHDPIFNAWLNSTYIPENNSIWAAIHNISTNVSGDFVRRTGDNMSGQLNMTGNDIVGVGVLEVHNITGRSPIIISSPVISDQTITASEFFGSINGQNGTIFGMTIVNGTISNLRVNDSAFFDTNITVNGLVNGSDFTLYGDGIYIYKNGLIFYFNESKLNQTVLDLVANLTPIVINITNNITTTVNITTFVTNNITVENNITNNITTFVTNNITTENNITNNISSGIFTIQDVQDCYILVQNGTITNLSINETCLNNTISLIAAINDTNLFNMIASVNTSSNIKSLGFNLTSELQTLFYPLSNPQQFINNSGEIDPVSIHELSNNDSTLIIQNGTITNISINLSTLDARYGVRIVLFMKNDTSDLYPDSKNLSLDLPTDGQKNITVLNMVDGEIFGNWTSIAQPISFINMGIIVVHFDARKNPSSKATTLTPMIYLRNSTDETLISVLESTEPLTATMTEYMMAGVVNDTIVGNDTSIELKINVSALGAGVAPDVTVGVDDGSMARVELPTTIGSVVDMDTAFLTALTTETNARINNDSYILGLIGNLTDNDSMFALNSSLNDEIVGRIGNDSALNQSIITETNARIGNDSYILGIVGNITDDDSAFALNSSLNNEIAARQGNDSALNSSINAVNISLNNETIGRIGNDTALNASIAAVNASLNNETAGRIGNDTALNTTILDVNQTVIHNLFNNDSTMILQNGITTNVSANLTFFDDRYGRGNLDFFFINTSSDIAGYKYANITSVGVEATNTTSASDGQLLGSWITYNNTPAVTFIESGVYLVHMHAAKTGGTQTGKIYAQVYRRDTSGTEFLLSTTETGTALSAVISEDDLHGLFSSNIIMNTTDRLVVKIYANVTGAGTAPVVVLHYAGTTDSRLEITSPFTAITDDDTAYTTGSGAANQVATFSSSKNIKGSNNLTFTDGNTPSLTINGTNPTLFIRSLTDLGTSQLNFYINDTQYMYMESSLPESAIVTKFQPLLILPKEVQTWSFDELQTQTNVLLNSTANLIIKNISMDSLINFSFPNSFIITDANGMHFRFNDATHSFENFVISDDQIYLNRPATILDPGANNESGGLMFDMDSKLTHVFDLGATFTNNSKVWSFIKVYFNGWMGIWNQTNEQLLVKDDKIQANVPISAPSYVGINYSMVNNTPTSIVNGTGAVNQIAVFKSASEVLGQSNLLWDNSSASFNITSYIPATSAKVKAISALGGSFGMYNLSGYLMGYFTCGLTECDLVNSNNNGAILLAKGNGNLFFVNGTFTKTYSDIWYDQGTGTYQIKTNGDVQPRNVTFTANNTGISNQGSYQIWNGTNWIIYNAVKNNTWVI